MWKYSPSTRGFYRATNATAPADCVEVSDERKNLLLQQEAAGMVIVPGPNGQPEAQARHHNIADLRAAKLVEIDMARDSAIIGGFEFNGVMYDSDPKSIQRINGAVTLSMLDPTYETEWITFDNGIVTLDAAGLAGLGVAAGAHEKAQIFKARQLKDQALAATTVSQLNAITW